MPGIRISSAPGHLPDEGEAVEIGPDDLVAIAGDHQHGQTDIPIARALPQDRVVHDGKVLHVHLIGPGPEGQGDEALADDAGRRRLRPEGLSLHPVAEQEKDRHRNGAHHQPADPGCDEAAKPADIASRPWGGDTGEDDDGPCHIGVIEGEMRHDGSGPGVPDDHGVANLQPAQSGGNEGSLPSRFSLAQAPLALAPAMAGTVEGDHPVML
jgi:hypothetical protein